MKISYLVTCSTETKTLKNLFEKLILVLPNSEDEAVVLIDSDSVIPETKEICNRFLSGSLGQIRLLDHSLSRNYGAHKNWGAEQCNGNWIFQIDGDEVPSEFTLGDNLHEIIKSNPDMDLIYVPRINDFRGVQDIHAKQWGWHLTISPIYKRYRVNWPDYQPRVFLRDPSRIKWDRRLHEKIEGFTNYATLPADEEFALYHDKTIEKQVETNVRYNQWFTEEENRGHDVFSQKKL
jgi:glycosyltransferase involved in cell wall biosynthesis